MKPVHILFALVLLLVVPMVWMLTQSVAVPTPADGADEVVAAQEEAAVVAVVQAFFDALRSRDVDAFAATMLDDGSIHAASMRPGGALPPPRGRTTAYDIDWLATVQDQFLERMWDPEVRVHGRLATLWTPYDFWLNGAFSHCGVDAFTLIKVTDGWRISSVAYTVEPDGCSSSPLGAPTQEQLRAPS